MRKGILSSLIFISACSLISFQGCKKENSLGIDNDKVVRTPYGLYAANSDGALVHSNDGKQFSDIFPPDGYTTHLLLLAGNNLMMLKENLHLSRNMGTNFNPVFNNVKKFPWQTMAYVIEGHGRIYITSKEGRGISYSEDEGLTWLAEENFMENLPPSFEISSFSAINKTILFGYSNKSNILFRKDNADENWTPVTVEGLFPVEGTQFYLSSNETTLFLTDYLGKGGVWYSEDEGNHWFKFNQGALPKNVKWNAAISPSGGRTFLVGTEDMGAYRVENDVFVKASGGLESETTVHSFSNKKNIFKNDVVKPYVFMGTNTGIYISEDRGTTWDKVTFGEKDKDYVATY